MKPLQFCTIASRQYLAHARALAQSIERTNPSSRLWVLLADDHRHEVQREREPFLGVWNEEIGIERNELHRMFLIHSGYFAAIKPWFIEHVLRESGGPVLHIDSDTQVYDALDDIADAIESHGALVTPHIVSPYPLDGKLPDDTAILGAGTFNAGMIGVGSRGTALLTFLQSRLKRECLVDVAKMRVNEQRWLDFLPAFMGDNLCVLRDTGINAAYWNLHERPLSRVNGQVFAGEQPLRVYHFSGYELEHPDVLSRFAPAEVARVTIEAGSILAELCADYRRAIERARNGETMMSSIECPQLPGDITLDDSLRAVYRASLLLAERTNDALPPDGYEISEREAFIAWARWAYPAAGLAVPAWAAPPGLEDVVRRLVETTAQAVATIETRLALIEAGMSVLGAEDLPASSTLRA